MPMPERSVFAMDMSEASTWRTESHALAVQAPYIFGPHPRRLYVGSLCPYYNHSVSFFLPNTFPRKKLERERMLDAVYADPNDTGSQPRLLTESSRFWILASVRQRQLPWHMGYRLWFEDETILLCPCMIPALLSFSTGGFHLQNTIITSIA